MTSSRVVLLDIDGVVYRNKSTLAFVKHRIVKYVQKRVEVRTKKYVSDAEALFITDKFYKKFGHTLSGMWAIYGKEDDLSLDNFNKFVYNDHTMRVLSWSLGESERRLDGGAGSDIIKACKDRDLQIGVFSNAPVWWCSAILEGYGAAADITGDMVYTSSHPLYTEEQRLKPVRSLYVDIAAAVNKDIVFIDDSYINLTETAYMDGWIPVHFNNSLRIQAALDMTPQQASEALFIF